MSKKKKNIPDVTPNERLNLAEKEARFLLWCFSKKEAQKYIDLHLDRTGEDTQSNNHKFWKEVNASFNAIIAGRVDEIDECIQLLDFVNTMKPREKWVKPLTDSIVFNDFRAQLFTIIEDYKDEWMKRKSAVNDGS